jgi:hypothetical protein
MNEPQSTIDELESDRAQRRQRREWTAEKVGRRALFLIPVLAMLGVFGPGLLSERSATSGDGRVRVTFHAVERRASPCDMRIHVRPATASRNVRLTLSRSFADRTSLDSSVPAPDSVVAGRDSVVYVFQTAPRMGEEVDLLIRYTHECFGAAHFSVGLEGGEVASITQWVLP